MSEKIEKVVTFQASKSSGNVSGILLRPAEARWLLVLGHGAGAGMRHAFMENLAQQLANNGIATLRYNFPYIEQGKKAPDPAPILMAAVRSASAKAAEIAEGLPLLAGGKSMGGRMTSNAQAKEPIPHIKGIVFFGFPLHAPGRPSSERSAHLLDIHLPMLFLQGTRDKLADLSLLRPVCEKLRLSTLHVIDGADHSFHVLKSAGRTDEDVLAELGRTVATWADTAMGS